MPGALRCHSSTTNKYCQVLYKAEVPLTLITYDLGMVFGFVPLYPIYIFLWVY